MRTHYKNGDEIVLKEIGCDGCNPIIINDQVHHERDCPEMWRDCIVTCKWCGAKFVPSEQGQEFCSDSCCDDYYG